jgi:hypothetical protein
MRLGNCSTEYPKRTVRAVRAVKALACRPRGALSDFRSVASNRHQAVAAMLDLGMRIMLKGWKLPSSSSAG